MKWLFDKINCWLLFDRFDEIFLLFIHYLFLLFFICDTYKTCNSILTQGSYPSSYFMNTLELNIFLNRIKMFLFFSKIVTVFNECFHFSAHIDSFCCSWINLAWYYIIPYILNLIYSCTFFLAVLKQEYSMLFDSI